MGVWSMPPNQSGSTSWDKAFLQSETGSHDLGRRSLDGVLRPWVRGEPMARIYLETLQEDVSTGYIGTILVEIESTIWAWY
jgi:hypothetical protein